MLKTYYIKTLTIFTLALLLNCVSKKNKGTIISNKETTWCPSEGICNFEILQNKKLLLLKDQFNNGYTEIIDGNSTVITFTYIKNSSSEYEDQEYKEVVSLQIDDLDTAFEAKNNELIKFNATFSRFCFCRGQTGTYKLTNGNLKLTPNRNGTKLHFSFQNEKVPQIISFVEETF